MSKPVFELINHRGKPRIKVSFEKNDDWIERMKKVYGAKWSKTLRSWHIPDTPENRKKCKLPLNELSAIIPQTVAATDKAALAHVSANNKKQLELFQQQLLLKAYSASTIRTYRIEFAQLLYLLHDTPVQDLQPQHLQRYLLWCIKKGLTEHAIHSRINALKFYFEQVLKREKFFFEIPRPKRPIQLPKVLNETEIKRMFAAVPNLKHKAILFTAYSAGLRVSEVVHLRIRDIDSKRMQIFVARAKGKKDRVVNLSILLLHILRQYLKMQHPQPVDYLFTAPDGKTAYSERSAQKIFQEAKRRAGIHKDVSFHSLRHSFATHLLEKGVDVKYIKELLGHFDIRTTERYLHVSKEKLVSIVSPLDSLYEEEERDLRITDTGNTQKRIERH
jgi:integrase/recombinase XerD